MFYTNLFLYTFSNFLYGLLFPVFFEPKKKKIPNVMYGLIYFGVMLIPSVLKFFTTPYSDYFVLLYLLALLVTFLFIHFSFYGSVWTKTLFMIILLSAMILGERTAFYIFGIFGISIVVDFAASGYLLLMLITLLSSIIFLLFIAALWKKVFSREVVWEKTQMGLVLLLFGFLMNISLLIPLGDKHESATQFWGVLSMVAGAMLEVIALFIIILYYEKKKKTAQIEDLETAMRASREKYEFIEKEIEGISKKRHDRNNQMIIIKDFLDKKDGAGLKKFIDEIGR